MSFFQNFVWFLFGFCLVSSTSFSQENSNSIISEVVSSSGLKHPGILNSKYELDLLRADLESGNSYRTKLFDHVTGIKEGRLTNPYKANPVETIVAFEDGSNNFKYDGQAAYIHSILWVLTGDTTHAQIAIDILNAWSGKLKAINPKPGDQDNHALLFGGIYIGDWPNSAEILKYSGAPWHQDDQDAFSDMVRNVFLGQCLTEYRSNYNGNWDLANEWSRLACYVWLDDKNGFDEVLNRIKEGQTNGSIVNYLSETGQNQETGRDQNHAQMGLEFLAYSAEIAWNQGIDIYEYKDRSLGRAFEYTAKYNLGYDVPFDIYPSPVGSNSHDYNKEPGSYGRGTLNPIYERVYHHYHDRLKQELSMVKKVLEEKTRPNSWGGIWFTRWDDFICGNLTVDCPIKDTIKVNACFEYTSPSGKHIWTASGNYSDTIANSCGADSIINIILSIDTVDTSVTFDGTALVGTAENARFKWLGCDNDLSFSYAVYNKKYEPISSGNYRVKVDQVGCVDTSACYNITLTGLNELKDDDKVKVFPNPTNGMVHIYSDNGFKNATLYSESGKIVMTEIKHSFDIQNLPSGLYFLELDAYNKHLVKKIIKK